MGRPPIEKYIDPKRIIKAYKQNRSLAQVGRIFFIHPNTVKAVLDRHKVERRPRIKPKGKHSHIRNWLYSLDPEERSALPENRKRIAEISGFKYSSVTKFYWREIEFINAHIESLPDIRNIKSHLAYDENKMIHTDEIESYEFIIHRGSLDISIVANTSIGRITIPLCDVTQIPRIFGLIKTRDRLARGLAP